MIARGCQSEAAKKKAHDYWKQNLATWKDAPQPEIVDARREARARSERAATSRPRGSFALSNPHDVPLKRFALTGGFHWTDAAVDARREDVRSPRTARGSSRSRPRRRSRPVAAFDVGFAYEGTSRRGSRRTAAGAAEFILPSGVVLTGFAPSFVPSVGYDEAIGIEEDKNRYESRVYPDDFYVGRTEPAFGSGSAFTARIEIAGPGGVHATTRSACSNPSGRGRRAHGGLEDRPPVRFFNVVAGRWAEAQGRRHGGLLPPGAHVQHRRDDWPALDGARKYYSEWFREFPWNELKLSEFPALATYAQGFPTDITFSEGIGFLTQQEETGNAPFTITAHEAAHQWWGNMLLPGKGPGGDLLSEGMSHFSTILLIEQVKGLAARIEFCKRIEESYGDDRQVDSEKPLVKIDGSQARRHDGHLRQDGLGRVDAAAGDGPREPAAGSTRVPVGVRREPRSPGAAGLHRLPARVRAGRRRVRRLRQAVVPRGRRARIRARGGEEGSGWRRLERDREGDQPGAGTIPVEVAVVKGERFDEKGVADADYQDARATVTLGARESKDVAIRCDFEPERVLSIPTRSCSSCAERTPSPSSSAQRRRATDSRAARP